MNRTNRHDATPTDRTRTDRCMRNVSHTHPYADRGALANLFERGPVVAADGGERNGYDAREEEDDETEEEARQTAEAARKTTENARMRDVDHTAPHGEGESVNRVFERGGREEPVESEE